MKQEFSASRYFRKIILHLIKSLGPVSHNKCFMHVIIVINSIHKSVVKEKHLHCFVTGLDVVKYKGISCIFLLVVVE